MSFFSALFSNPFLQYAIAAGFLASIASGFMGSFVVAKKISSISGSISHSILGGIGLSIFLNYKFSLSWFDPILGAFVAAILASLLIGWIHLKHRGKEDAAIATIWSTGMGLGVIFIALVPSYSGDFTHFLFGNILVVTKTHLFLLFAFDLLIIFILSINYRKFLSICFDEKTAYLQKINVSFMYLLLLILISFSIVLLIQIIGIILVIALLTIPATIASLYNKKLYKIMFISSILSFIFIFLGIGISYDLNIPPGACIAILSALAYVLCLLFAKKAHPKMRR